MTNSIYDGIAVGDEVGVQDHNHNFVRGPVRLVDAGQSMGVEAFGYLIPFARRNKNKTWVAISGIKLTEHQPTLGLMA